MSTEENTKQENEQVEREIPTLKELRQSGRFEVDVWHSRFASVCAFNGKPAVVKKLLPLSKIRQHNDMVKGGMAAGNMPKDAKYHIEPRGGETELFLKDLETGRDYHGVAICSKKDNFNRRESHKQCLKRILAANPELEGIIS